MLDAAINTGKYLLILFFPLVLFACSGGSGGDAPSTLFDDSSEAENLATPGNPMDEAANAKSAGSVTLYLTDKPRNDEFDEVWMTITRIELISAEKDGEKVLLFEGEEDIDLLSLKHFSVALSLNDDVPAGKYSKIRLYAEKVLLVELDDEGEVINTIEPKLPGNGKIDLNPRKTFEVVAGEELRIQIDIDADKSIHVHGKDDKFHFRPVVFVDVLSDSFSGKLVRLAGTVSAIDEEHQRLKICDNEIYAVDKEATRQTGCLDVLIEEDDATTLLDADLNNIDLDNIAVGDAVVLVGHSGIRVTREAEDEDKASMTQHGLTAEVLVLTDTLTMVDGVIEESVNDEQDALLLLDDGQGIVDDAQLRLRMVEGAKIFSRDGVQLQETALQQDRTAQAEGLLDIGDETLLTAWAFLDESEFFEKLSGEISSLADLEDDNQILISNDDDSFCVQLTDDSRLFEVTDDSSTEIGVDSLELEAELDVYGDFSEVDCFVVDTLLLYGGE